MCAQESPNMHKQCVGVMVARKPEDLCHGAANPSTLAQQITSKQERLSFSYNLTTNSAPIRLGLSMHYACKNM